MDRRAFLVTAGYGAWLGVVGSNRLCSAGEPADDPLAALKLGWNSEVRWTAVVDVTRMNGDTIEQKLAMAQTALAMKGGGVAYFPAGTYKFTETIKLLDGIILRGADPGPVKSAHNEKYSLPTKFEFPKYEFSSEGDGTPILKAFKGRLRSLTDAVLDRLRV